MMYKNILITNLLLFSTTLLLAQQKFTVSGTVTDRKNGETVIGASVYVKDNRSANVITNSYGFYSITLPKGKYQLVFTMVGYQSDTVDIELSANLQHNNALTEKANELSEVVVTSKKANENLLKP